MTPAAVMPTAVKAYSYIRFSTPAQAKGDSHARQTDRATRYAAEHGLELDSDLTLTDLGVSGYRGKNVKQGAFGLFLKAIEEGRVAKGSYLLIENLDRLTRDEISEAMPVFLQIVNAGVVVVTLTNQEAYSKERLRKEPHAIYGVISELIRANQESFYKGQRVADAKERKRTRLAQGALRDRAYTRQTPGWIKWSEETRSYELIPERAAVIREVFSLADQGWGLDRIARELNRREVETWGEGKRKAAYWRGSYLRKIVNSKAPIGLFTPSRTTRDEETRARRDVALDPVPLFPAAVDAEVYWKVVRRFQTTAPRGRNATLEPASIVAGVAKCTCGASMIRVSKGRSRGKLYVYLLCARAHEKAKGCEHLPVRYDDVVQALTGNAAEIIEGAPGGKDTADIEAEIRNLDAYLDKLSDDVEGLADLAAHDRSPAATKRFRDKERDLERHRKELRELRARKETLTHASVRARLQKLQAALQREPLNVGDANGALRQTMRKIVVDPKQAALEIHWHHSEETDTVSFYSRHITIFDNVGDASSGEA